MNKQLKCYQCNHYNRYFAAISGSGRQSIFIIRYPSEDKTVVRFGFVIINDTKRGKGYGKAMLNLAIDYAQKQLGAKKITLGVFTENPSAIACYKSVGFKITSERNHIIDGEEWKGVEMERKITL